jgi:hypothetical protein
MLLAFFVSVLYMVLVEYVVHRWYMHDLVGGETFVEHAIEHHREGINDDRHLLVFGRSMFLAWVIGSILLLAVSWWIPVTLAVTMLWWWTSWTLIHRIVHGTGNKIVLAHLLCPWAFLVIRHHRIHHEHPGCNFGAIFIFTDLFFGTMKL